MACIEFTVVKLFVFYPSTDIYRYQLSYLPNVKFYVIKILFQIAFDTINCEIEVYK